MASSEEADVYEYPKLYKKDARGVVREYEVYVEVLDSGVVKLYRVSRIHETSSGDPGKPVIQVRIIKGKVKRSDLEQAQNMAVKYWLDQKNKKGYSEDVDVPATRNIIPMTAFIYTPGITKLDFPVLLQPKYDGSRTIAMCEGESVTFYSRSRSLTYRMPHLSEVLKPILCGKYEGLILDGELMNDKNRQWESSGLLRRMAKEDPNDDLQDAKGKRKETKKDREMDEYRELIKDTYLVLYDCYVPGNESEPFRDRFKTLRELYHQIPKKYHNIIRIAPTESARAPTEITRAFDLHLEGGFEGTMIRVPNGAYCHNRTKNLLKLKGVQDADFLIVDVIEADNEPGSRLVLQTDSGKQFNVRPRGDLEYRQWLLKHRNRIIGLKATIQYASLSEDGIPQHPRVHQEQSHPDLTAQVRDT